MQTVERELVEEVVERCRGWGFAWAEDAAKMTLRLYEG
jgi:hypothetical protein